MDYLRDLPNAIQLGAGVYPSDISETQEGNTIDLIAADGRCFAIQAIGTVTGTTPSLTGKMQESSDGSTWTDITGAVFTAVTASNSLQSIGFLRTKRYVRHYATVSGTTPVFPTAVVIGEQKKFIA